jgi:hypothetical protein
MKRPALEAVLRAELERAARSDLVVHFFSFSSRAVPPDLLTERALVAELGGEGRYGMVLTRGSHDRSPPEVIDAVGRMATLPGFARGFLLSIEASAVPLDQGYLLRLAERRLEDNAADGPTVHRVVVHQEVLPLTPQ